MLQMNERIDIYVNDGNNSIMLGVVTDINTTMQSDQISFANRVIVPVCVVNVSYVQPVNDVKGTIIAPVASFNNVFTLKKENGEEYGIFN